MPTRTGLGVLIASVMLAVLGVRVRYAELIIVAIMAAVAVLAAAVVVRRAPTVVVLRGPLPVRVERDSEVRCRVKVTATSRRGMAATTLRDRFNAEAVSLELPPTASDRLISAAYGLHTTRRGIATVGPLSVRRADPLGLVVGEHLIAGSETTVLVHPRITPLHGHRFLERTAGAESALRRGGSDPTSGFQSLRAYIAGDDTRTIHWPTTARTGTFMVREFADPHRPSLSVVLITDAADFTDDSFDQATEIAVSLCSHAIRRGIDVHLATTDRANPGSTRSLRTETEALDLLARVGLTTGEAMRPLGEIVHVMPRATSAFIVSGRSEEGMARFGDLADQVMYVSVAPTTDGLPRIIGNRGDDVVAPTVGAFAQWWAQAS